MKIQSKYKENTIQIQSKRHQNKPYSKSNLVLERKKTRKIRGNTSVNQENMRKYDEKTRKYRRKRQRKYEENMKKYEEKRREK